MKDAYGKDLKVGDRIAFARRVGKYSKNHVIVKGVVTEVKKGRITYVYERWGKNHETWTSSSDKILVI